MPEVHGRKCSVCGEPAAYLVSLHVEIWDLETTRTRIKQINLYLCVNCEANSRKFFRRDANQLTRIGQAITPELRLRWTPLGVQACPAD
jgi:hypothetical protein